MNSKRTTLIIMVIMASLWTIGCSRDKGTLEPAPISTDPVVFTDNFGAHVDFQAFLNSKLDAVQIDTDVKFDGTASLRISVPGPGDPTGWFAGGAFVDAIGRDLTGYDAITFYARSSKASATLNVAGLGNDNTGTSLYEASTDSLALTTAWAKYIIPIPLPAKLSLEKGLFYFAEGYEEDDLAYTMWFDDIIFEKTGLVTDPRPDLEVDDFSAYLGTSVDIPGTSVTFDVDGTDMLVNHMPAYFTFFSSDEDVAKVINGKIQSLSVGNATITAALGSIPASGEIAFTALAAPVVPAPTPTQPANNVISIFSDSYTDVLVDSYSPDWDEANLTDFSVDGDNILLYTNINTYAAILFETSVINATAMDYLHIDFWLPSNVTSVGVKLVDFGEDGVYQGAPDSEKELIFSAGSVPPITPGSWSSLDIPLADFMVPGGLVSRAALAQLFITGADITAFVDNIYFYEVPPGQ
jgi:hypothetical protein